MPTMAGTVTLAVLAFCTVHKASAEAHFRRDIDDALAMLREAAEKSPLLARALARATES